MRLSIVCYLEPASTVTVRDLQNKLTELTGSRASLDLWEPHITVGDGVEVDEVDVPSLRQAFLEIARATKSFRVKMDGYLKVDFRKGGKDETTSPYGLYLRVQKSPELLQLVETISKNIHDYRKWYHMPSPYTPHCALAYKDLSKQGFQIGSEYLDSQDIMLEATIDHVALVETTDRQTREFERFSFTKN